eukprot:GHVU01055590.1.p1 GENE.GHVU01055590.1~~GHVU01055590.1.p1  ORF type:complete len:379 (-),score=54.11 GHVU01055590.1:827-1963(-)
MNSPRRIGSNLDTALATALSKETLVRLMKSILRITSEMDHKNTMNVILNEAKSVLGCTSCILYIHDEATEHLMRVSSDGTEARIKHSTLSPIVNSVHRTGTSILRNCPPAGGGKSTEGVEWTVPTHGQGSGDVEQGKEEQEIFPLAEEPTAVMHAATEGDADTGYASIVASPVLGNHGKVVAVLKAVGPKTSRAATNTNTTAAATAAAAAAKEDQMDVFTAEDQIILETVGSVAGVALANAFLYRATVVSRERAQGLLTILQTFGTDLGFQSTVLGLTTHAKQLIGANHCTVFLVDRSLDELITISSDTGTAIRETLVGNSPRVTCAKSGVTCRMETEERDILAVPINANKWVGRCHRPRCDLRSAGCCCRVASYSYL